MNVTLSVYDARGRLVRELADGLFAQGDHTVNWDGTDNTGKGASSGTYFARLRTADGQVNTRNLVLLK